MITGLVSCPWWDLMAGGVDAAGVASRFEAKASGRGAACWDG